MSTRNVMPDDFVKFPHAFPTRENCDPNNPYQAFLWMLVALPFQSGGQLVFPVDYLQFVSKRLWDCGVRPTAEPGIKYKRPDSGDPNWLQNPGSWVAADAPDDPDPRRPVVRAADTLANEQQTELARELVGRMTPAQRRKLLEEGG